MEKLAIAVGNLSGQLATIEKRPYEKDKLVDNKIELEMMKVVEKLRRETGD